MKKTGPRCTICAHRECAGIDLALARGVSVRALAKRYDVGPDSIYRHAKNHLPPQLRASLITGPDLDIDLDKLRETEGQSLLANLIALRGRLFASLDVAEEAGDGRTAIQLLRAVVAAGVDGAEDETARLRLAQLVARADPGEADRILAAFMEKYPRSAWRPVAEQRRADLAARPGGSR